MAIEPFESGNLEQAKASCFQALDIDPTDISAVRLLVEIYDRQGDTDRLIEMLHKAHSLEPGNVDNLYRLAAALRSRGSFDEARDAYVRALRLQPGRPDVYYNLAMITHYSAYSEEVATMETLFSRSAGDSEERRNLAFALGKIFDDLGEYDRAFGFFSEGNHIAGKAAGHSIAANRRWFAEIKSTFDAAFLQRYRDIGSTDRTPIFIAGLPRSGTTLVEQILASHADVKGGGELTFLHTITADLASLAGGSFPAGCGQLDPDVLRDKTRFYLEQVGALAQGTARVTDKSLTIFTCIGLISVMMPDAIVIDCRRDPRDQGLSLFQKDMRAQSYGYDLESIGSCYRLYHDLLEHWERLLPGKILRIRYEELVTDPQTGIRRLLDHCELDFDEACLSFYRTERVVLNASNMQVRQPVYADSVGRWKNYAQHLEPLLAALGSDLTT